MEDRRWKIEDRRNGSFKDTKDKSRRSKIEDRK
jgi:hypothetical protein